MYFHLYLAEVDRLSQSDTAREKSDFKRMPFESPSNGITGSFQWSVLRSRLTALHAKLMEEVEEWRAWGAAQTQLVQEGWDSSVNSCMHHLRQEEERLRGDGVDGTSIGSEHTNTSVWVATIFGPAETLWDGGMFQVELVFPPNFPDSPPFVRFVTPIFHPHINEQGVPYLRQLITWHCCEPKQRTLHALLHALVSLLATSPSPEPVTHLDARAAALYFSSTDGQKEYNREVKKRVQRSVEM